VRSAGLTGSTMVRLSGSSWTTEIFIWSGMSLTIAGSSLAQPAENKRERIEDYFRMKDQCDAGKKQACVKVGQMQGAIYTHLKDECQHGDRTSCERLHHLQERQHQKSMR
jgi:hypothetical protein